MGKRKSKSTHAQTMLDILEDRFPDGVTTSELATLIHGKDELATRTKIQRTARVLRQWGYRAHSFGGIYSLCNKDAQKLNRVFCRNLKGVYGLVLSTRDVAGGIGDAGDIAMATTAQRELRQVLRKLTSKL